MSFKHLKTTEEALSYYTEVAWATVEEAMYSSTPKYKISRFVFIAIGMTKQLVEKQITPQKNETRVIDAIENNERHQAVITSLQALNIDTDFD